MQHATHAELEKELGFSLSPPNLDSSTTAKNSSDDLPSFLATLRSGKRGTSHLIHVVDQIYDSEDNTIDGSMLYNDIGETAQVTARLTDDPSTYYHGESSGAPFT